MSRKRILQTALMTVAAFSVAVAQSDKPTETVSKGLSAREIKKREKAYRKELETPYRKWLTEDVGYIITDEERQSFKKLETDEERQQFIESFWFRRDPTPDTMENEFKEEHYRRIAYSNERYASGIPGWRTDRGRIYITFGPADEIESRPSGGTYERPFEEGGGTTSVYPFEKWRYRYIEGIGQDIVIEFVDTSMTGEYRMTMDPSEKDALTMVPGAGLTTMEQMGMASKNDRFSRTDGTRLGTGNQPLPARMQQFERLQQFALLQRAPKIKFKDLEAAINSQIKYNLLPMDARVDFLRQTENSIQTNITLQFPRRELNFKDRSGMSEAAINIYARVSTMSRRPVQVFEDVVTISVPTEMLQQVTEGFSIYQKGIPLPPGTYRLNVVAKDVIGGNMINHELALNVPRYEEGTLGKSSLILADLIEKVPTRNIGTGQFVVGSTKVRPRMNTQFKKNERMGIYMQVYNLGQKEGSSKPEGSILYEVTKNGENKKMFEFSEDLSKIEGASTYQTTIEKILPLTSFEPGAYTIKITVSDKVNNQTVTESGLFVVNAGEAKTVETKQSASAAAPLETAAK
jgi:GWxTD domain-containing protein